MSFILSPDDGLYSLSFEPINWNDPRFESLSQLDVTLEDDPAIGGVTPAAFSPVAPNRSPNKLGVWHTKIFWIGKCLALPGVCKGFNAELDEFCSQYIAPLSTPSSRRTYQIDNIGDMADLSIRFFGIGTERLEKTLERSIGLTPKVKDGKKMRNKVPVPVHNFPQGRWKTGKTPKVSKGIVHNLHKASIAEAVFTDTFEVDDAIYRYGQAFIDYRSKFGEIVPMKSRTQVGWAFTVFCANHFIPLILIRDNISENVGGSLVEECLKRSVKSAFICPYKKQQNYAEGYLGRITALASYGMVFAGAPLFMWRWCVACAVFINNITATYYSAENLWATPYEVVHNEPFPDASIVVPFGCGVLVLLREEDRGKFKSRCALMIFAYYANQHPLYTYAVYSPRTKRILYRQDCIFLTNLFPMRNARSQNGLPLNGDSIVPYRSPETMRDGEKDEFSFCGWTVDDPLPEFQDHVSGHKLTRPAIEKTTIDQVEETSFVNPSHPMFGPVSVVKVHTPPKFMRQLGKEKEIVEDQEPTISDDQSCLEEENTEVDQTLGSKRPSRTKSREEPKPQGTQKRKPVKDRHYYVPVPQLALEVSSTEEQDPVDGDDDGWVAANSQYSIHHDKYEAAVAIQPFPDHDEYEAADLPSVGTSTVRQFGVKLGSYDGDILSDRTIRRILRAQETMFKYGTLIPRNDAEANKSPEAKRWMSGKQLEWLRLQQVDTFENQWTWEKVQLAYPEYRKKDIGHMFFIYDYKFSGEHRVRLVFDGSRQSEATFNNTYAPTVRPETVRLFHVYAVEYTWIIRQYDVPQAFLRSKADCDIFVHPPNGFSEFPGQLLKLAKMLYGSKQAAHLWFNLLNDFLFEVGFTSSHMDPCFYRRLDKNGEVDAIIILHVDDMRVAATEEVINVIHKQLYDKFEITTSDTGRFLGMDADYDMDAGILRMHMATYIQNTVDRFHDFDVTKGVPYREIVGSLLWITLNVMGPELLRIKDLARRSNNFTVEDYTEALKALRRVHERMEFGIIYRRGGAGKETVPRNSRLGGDNLDNLGNGISMLMMNLEEPYSTGDSTMLNELKESDLYKLDEHDDPTLDIAKVLEPTNERFTKVAYADASFAATGLKQSISGLSVMINGTPILWSSLKQTVVVDSTCSSEYVAASVCSKSVMQVENMVQFLKFTCPKPYTMYTDSQACLQIANASSKLGKVRHIEIRYHLVRCLIIAGDIKLVYCVTEDMIADLFTKIVSGTQDKRLAVRFYNDCNMLLFVERA
jgi:hypothetical protein